MPVPSPRNKILPARGNFADLSANVASLLDGEICYAIDQDQYYQNESGTLVSVGATKAQGILADSAIQPGDNVSELTNDAGYITLAEVPGDLVTSVAGKTGDVTLVKADVGLGNVDNTSDVNKPISTSTQAALDLKADLVGGFVPTSQIPAIAITEFLGSVGSEAAMLALTGQPGDWCLRTDKAVGYVIVGADPSVIAGWEAFTVPGSAVTSINTQVGDVVLGAADVGAATAAQGVTADSAVQPADNVSVLTNDAGYVDAAGASAAAPVQSVAGKTGDVTLVKADITDFADGDYATAAQGALADSALQPGDRINAAAGTAAEPGVYFDASTGLYSPGAGQVALSTNGTGRLFVDASGRIGIGTAVPLHNLQVGATTSTGSQVISIMTDDSGTGELRFSDATDFNQGMIQYSHSSDYMMFQVNNSERLRITSAGLVGIGTSTPETFLHVKSTSQFDETDASQTAGILVEQSGGTAANGAYSTAITLCKINSSRPGGAIASVQTSADVDQLGLAFLTHSSTTTDSTLGEALRITHDGKVGIGDTGPDSTLTVKAASGVTPFKVSGPSSEFAKIDTSGRLLVGTSSGRGISTTSQASLQIENSEIAATFVRNTADQQAPVLSFGKTRGTTSGSTTNVIADTGLGQIRFCGSDGTSFVQGARIDAFVDGTPGANDMPGRLVFSTTADGASSPTERMRIQNDGAILFGQQAFIAGVLNIGNYTNGGKYGVQMRPSADNATPFAFENAAGTVVGTIQTTSSTTAYYTSSDYRLKENVTPVTDGITRLQQLKPSRFNFIADVGTTVDGFLAHEVQDIVPEAITGEKDAVDEDGNPVYQGIDQSKLVPLLTAALQEAIAKIETLEAKVAALEAS